MLIARQLFTAKKNSKDYENPTYLINNMCTRLNKDDFRSTTVSPVNIFFSVFFFKAGCLCNNAQIKNGQLMGQPTEGAIVAVGLKVSISIGSHFLNAFIA